MEDFGAPSTVLPNTKPKRKKNPQLKENSRNHETTHSSPRTLKPSKRVVKADFTSVSPKIVGSVNDALLDPSMSKEYRTLRRKYLLLEEESFNLDEELGEVDGAIKTLEDEKFALLDKLVILEGLIDPLDMQPK